MYIPTAIFASTALAVLALITGALTLLCTPSRFENNFSVAEPVQAGEYRVQKKKPVLRPAFYALKFKNTQ